MTLEGNPPPPFFFLEMPDHFPLLSIASFTCPFFIYNRTICFFGMSFFEISAIVSFTIDRLLCSSSALK